MRVVYGQECADVSTIQDCSVHWEIQAHSFMGCYMVHLGFMPNDNHDLWGVVWNIGRAESMTHDTSYAHGAASPSM